MDLPYDWTTEGPFIENEPSSVLRSRSMTEIDISPRTHRQPLKISGLNKTADATRLNLPWSHCSSFIFLQTSVVCPVFESITVLTGQTPAGHRVGIFPLDYLDKSAISRRYESQSCTRKITIGTVSRLPKARTPSKSSTSPFATAISSPPFSSSRSGCAIEPG